jgi:hypothetical protein
MPAADQNTTGSFHILSSSLQTNYEGYSESKDTKSRKYICKAFFLLDSLVALLQHRHLLFNIVTMDRNALSKPGKEFFFIPASQKSSACSLRNVITASSTSSSLMMFTDG